MSAKKIWMSLAFIAFLSISTSAISHQKDEAYTDNTNTENQAQASIQAEPTSSTPTLAESSSTDTEDKDQLFLLTLESSASWEANKVLEQIPDYQKIAFGKEVCQSFSEGMTFEDFATRVALTYGNNLTVAELAGRLVGAGVGAYCPEYSYKVQ